MLSHPDGDTTLASCRAIETRARAAAPVTVLYLIDELHRMGGAENALLNILRYLPRDAFRPLVATFRYSPTTAALQNLPAPLHVFPLRRVYDLNAVKAAIALRRLIRDEGVSIVHTFFETSDLWGGVVARLSGCPALISSRRDMGILRNWKHRLAYKALGRIFDQVQTVSENLRGVTIERDWLPSGRVMTLHNGVDVAATDAIDRDGLCRRLEVPPSWSIVMTVANVRPIKGIDVLLRAAAGVCRSLPETMFVIVGDAPDPAYLRQVEQLAGALGIGANVRFLGYQPNLRSLLPAADAFALLSWSEGFSNAILEAMASRLACVVSDAGGNPEAVLDGQNGWVVACGDHSAAAGKLISLLTNVEERDRMGRRSLALVQTQFTIEAMIRRLTASYEAVLR